LFGGRPDFLVKAAKIIEDTGCDIIDLNLGCPDPNVIKQGAGSALLKKPKKVGEIISKLVKAVKIPVTAKIRIDKNKEKTFELVKIIEESGASAVAVHGRTVSQGYSGKANWQIIKEIKQKLKIPVILSGDIFSKEDAEKALKETKVDFLMLGRGCIGRPELFKEILQGKSITPKEKINLFFEYCQLAEKYALKFADIKRQAMNFTKGIEKSAKLRNKIATTKNIQEIKKLINDFI
jgi:nifR3 family TIM-barrel protein